MATRIKPSIPVWLIPSSFIFFILLSILCYYTVRPCPAPGKHKGAMHESGHGLKAEQSAGYITMEGPHGENIRVSSKVSEILKYLEEESTNGGAYTNKDNGSDEFWKTKN